MPTRMIPETTITTKYYTFRQNNSGGWFSGAAYVIVEAKTATEANELAARHNLLPDRNNWCPCCGERWREVREDDGYEFPSVYGEPLGTMKGYPSGSGVLIRHYDGRTEEAKA